jgi:hypothetical protein
MNATDNYVFIAHTTDHKHMAVYTDMATAMKRELETVYGEFNFYSYGKSIRRPGETVFIDKTYVCPASDWL